MQFILSVERALRMKMTSQEQYKRSGNLDRKFEPHQEKTNNVVSEQVRHKPVFTSTEEILDLKNRGLYYRCSGNKGADQLRSYCKADLRLCFCICRLLVFSCVGSF